MVGPDKVSDPCMDSSFFELVTCMNSEYIYSYVESNAGMMKYYPSEYFQHNYMTYVYAT